MKTNHPRDHITQHSLTCLGSWLAILLAGCGGGPMPPSEKNLNKLSDAVQAMSQKVTQKEINESETSDAGKKHLLKKGLMEPFSKLGYDINATLQEYTRRFKDGDFNQTEGAVIMGILMIYKEQAEDLAKHGLLTAEVARGLQTLNEK